MKRFAAIVVWFGFIAALFTLPASASGTVASGKYWTLDDTGTLTLSGMGHYSYQDGGRAPWYTYGSQIIKVTISRGVQYIGSYAFDAQSSIREVSIPDSVMTIGERAFRSCGGLREITIPASVTSIGSNAFRYSGLTDVYYEGNYAAWTGIWKDVAPSFAGINDEVHIHYSDPEASGSCGENVTYTLNTDTGEMLIGGSGGMISNPWYLACDLITTVIIQEGVTSIGSNAFYGCNSMTEVTIPDSVTSIGDYAFYDCSSLTEVTIPDGVASIENYTFYGCNSMTEVTIPDSVTSIGGYAFYDCSSLTEVTIPDSVASIGDGAFESCSSLTDVYYGGSFVEWDVLKTNAGIADDVYIHYDNPEASGFCGDDVTYTLNTDTGELTISGSGAMTDYYYDSYNKRSTAPWNSVRDRIKTVTVEDGVTHVGENAFAGCTALTHVSMGEDVETMGANAFQECTALHTVGPAGGGYDIEYSWRRYIPANAFYGANGLEEIVLPTGLLKIGDNAFRDCSALAKLVIPDDLEVIGSSIISGCTALDSLGSTGSGCALEIPWKADYLKAFLQNNSSLKQVEIPQEVTVIGKSMFYGCSGLEEFVIPARITRIEAFAFSGCSSLREITISGSLASIGNNAFANCSSLKNVYFPDSLTGLGSYVFQNCISLERVTIPGYIGTMDGLFSGCTGLKEVAIYNGVASISPSAFSGCTNLKTLYLPRSVTKIEAGAFYDCEKLWEVYYTGSQENWNDIEIGDKNAFLKTANIHYGENELGEIVVDIIPAEIVTAEGGEAYQITLYCQEKQNVTAFGARYDADGKFIDVVTLQLTAGEDNEMVVIADGAYLIRIMAVNSDGFTPICAALSLAGQDIGTGE